MKRKLTMLLALVLIAAMLSTSVMAGSSWLFYSREYSWDNGYRVSKATEYWYGDEEASEDPKETMVYEYTYNEFGMEDTQTVTTTEAETGDVTKEITRYFYDDEGFMTKVTYSVILPGETEEKLSDTSVYKYDEEGREIEMISYEGAEGGKVVYRDVYEYYQDTWRYAKRSSYYGETLEYECTYKYNDKEQRVEMTETSYRDGEKVIETTIYKYDDQGRMYEETCGDRVITHTFNDNGQRAKTVYKEAGEVTEEAVYTYDANGNTTKEVCTYADGESDTYEYTYNDRDQELTYTYNGELYTQNSYYANGKIKVRDYIRWGETYGYDYDSDGNNTKLTLTRKDYETEEPFLSAKVEIQYEADPDACWFDDVEVGSWYYAPVVWASYHGVTTGTDAGFAPKDMCTRSQVVTFLYRAAGYPEVTATECPFVDVDLDTWYSEAVLWAVENGITKGTDATHFSPDDKVSRSEFVTFLYRAAKAKAVDSENTFNDIVEGDWYYDAVLWAAENGITTGTSAGTFAPKGICSRAETVTFLYRYYG